jgi:hypothetical protein
MAWLLVWSYLVAVQLDEVAGLAREDAAKTLLLHDEARVVAHKKPLEVLGSHFERFYLSSVEMKSRQGDDGV